MTTDRKRQANQRNAQQSTGPRTSAGKARSKQNASKHGLSIPISIQPHFADLIQDLTTSLEQDAAPVHAIDGAISEIPVGVLEVLRARSVYSFMLDELAQHSSDPSGAKLGLARTALADLLQHLLRADRYQRRALSRRNRAIRAFSEAISL